LRDENTDEAPVTVTEQATMRTRGAMAGRKRYRNATQRNATQRREGEGTEGGELQIASGTGTREEEKEREKKETNKERKGTNKYMQCTHTQDTHAPDSDAK
jgi:hypothetical protein